VAAPAPRCQIVITDMDGGCTSAPFARHLLIDAGYPNVHLLDGGTPAWAQVHGHRLTDARPRFLELRQTRARVRLRKSPAPIGSRLGRMLLRPSPIQAARSCWTAGLYPSAADCPIAPIDLRAVPGLHLSMRSMLFDCLIGPAIIAGGARSRTWRPHQITRTLPRSPVVLLRPGCPSLNTSFSGSRSCMRAGL